MKTFPDPRLDEAQKLVQVAIHALLKGRFGRALEAYEELVELEPAVPRHRLRAADCLSRLGRTPEAIARYCQAARMYEAMGRETQALAVWRMAHALDPAHSDAARGLLEAEAALALQQGPSTRKQTPPPASEEPTPITIAITSEPAPADPILQSSRDAVLEELSRKQHHAHPAVGTEVTRIAELEARLHSFEVERANARRTDLERAIAADVSRARRFQLDLAVLVLDVPAGRTEDSIRELRDALRVSDAVGALADGRVAVSALGASLAGARRIAEKLSRALAAASPPISSRAGIVTLDAVPRPGPRDLLVLADAAVERAIAQGHRTASAVADSTDPDAAVTSA